MSTTSEVKAGLDSISQMISGSIKLRAQAKAGMLAARNQLANIPAQFTAVLAEIDGYTPTGAFETLAQDEKAKLAAEFAALKLALEGELDDLGVSYS